MQVLVHVLILHKESMEMIKMDAGCEWGFHIK